MRTYGSMAAFYRRADDGIRTRDLFLGKETRYQTAPHPHNLSQPVGRVLSPANRVTVIHLGPPLLTASRALPASIGRAGHSLSGLAPGGACRAAPLPVALVVSYTAVSPLPRAYWPGRSVFCGAVPQVTLGRYYRSPCPMEPGPSSPRERTRGSATVRLTQSLSTGSNR